MLYLKLILVATMLTGLCASHASTDVLLDRQYLTVASVDIIEVTDPWDTNPAFKQGNPPTIENAGKVITIARDLVALGEDIYKLVIKGKPTNVTKYAPISVVPRINGEAVDIFETEMWQAPVKRTYEVRYKNMYNVEVVVFRYSIIFAYGGTYNGKGAYLTSVQVIPESVVTLFGYDFTATMKLGGIQNNGTRDNPLAGATVLMEWTVSTVLVANTETRSFFLLGNGGYKHF